MDDLDIDITKLANSLGVYAPPGTTMILQPNRRQWQRMCKLAGIEHGMRRAKRRARKQRGK
jgi:hypothetical protein